MSDLDDQIPNAFDPFADANAEDLGACAKEYVHIRVQQRNGRKSLTTVQGLKKDYSYNKILKDLKKRVLLQWNCRPGPRTRTGNSTSRRSEKECLDLPDPDFFIVQPSIQIPSDS